jgi:hypothetical protein
MSALTADAIVDRLRSICCAEPFSFGEATSWDTFDLQPTTNLEATFRIPPPASQAIDGSFGDIVDDRIDSFQLWVARKHGGDHDRVRRTLLRDMHSLTAAVVRDGAFNSGDYHVEDSGRGHAIAPAGPGKEFVTLRLTLPIRYECSL